MPASRSTSRLLAVAVFSRHGERNPSEFPVTVFNVTGDALLTARGHEGMRRLGQKIRDRYQQFFTAVHDPDIRVKVSPFPRCSESAEDTLKGLVPGTEVPIETDRKLLIRFEAPTDQFLAVHHTYADITASVYKDKPQHEDDVNTVVMNTLIHSDNVRTCVDIGRPIPDSITSQMVERMREYLAQYVRSLISTEEELRKRALGFITTVVTDLLTAADSGKAAILIYNSHDVNIDYILTFMNFLPEGPARQPYAATLTFELHEDMESKDRLIHMWYNKEVDLYPGQLLRTATPEHLLE